VIEENMAFITNQWLKGAAERSRYHFPVTVSVEGYPTNDGWSKHNGVCAGITAKNADGNYQSIYLQEGDLDQLLPYLVERANAAIRQKLALDTLIGVDDACLLTIMTRLFGERARLAFSKNRGTE
jgi:hypothetical protein